MPSPATLFVANLIDLLVAEADMEDEIDIEVNLGKELADKLNKMSKKELLNRLCVMILKTNVQTETIEDLERTVKFGDKTLRSRLQRSEEYNGQARAMIAGIMERWDSYTGD